MRCPCGQRTGPARESSMFFISHGTRTGPVRDPQGCRMAPLRKCKGIYTTVIGKNPARTSYLAARAPHGPRTGCSWAVYNPKTRTGPVSLKCRHQNSTSPVRGSKIRMGPHGARAGPVGGRAIFFQNSP